MSNAFQIGSRCGDFFYKIGSVSTVKAWKNPNIKNLNQLIDDIKKIDGYKKFDLFLVGGVVNGRLGHTDDIDIILNGECTIEELEDFLITLYDLALNKHNLLVDVKWLNARPSSCVKENIVYTAIHFGYCEKKVGEIHSRINFFDRYKKIGKDLIIREILFPNEKSKKINKTNFVKI